MNHQVGPLSEREDRDPFREGWKVGNEWAPYHPSASHIEPGYRDGWNAAFRIAEARIADIGNELIERNAELASRAPVVQPADALTCLSRDFAGQQCLPGCDRKSVKGYLKRCPRFEPSAAPSVGVPLSDERAGYSRNELLAATMDTQRLNWLSEHEAWVGWNREGDQCSVWRHDEEGDWVRMTPLVSGKYETAREAIDAARAVLAASLEKP